MKTKIELDNDFIFPDDPLIVKQHNDMLMLTILFSIPVIGLLLLLIILVGEWLLHKLRIARLAFMLLWHKIY